MYEYTTALPTSLIREDEVGEGTKPSPTDLAALVHYFAENTKAYRTHLVWTGSVSGKTNSPNLLPRMFAKKVGGKAISLSARRVAWFIAHPKDPILPNEIIVMKCRNSRCVESTHLDKVRGGGRKKGSKNSKGGVGEGHEGGVESGAYVAANNPDIDPVDYNRVRTSEQVDEVKVPTNASHTALLRAHTLDTPPPPPVIAIPTPPPTWKEIEQVKEVDEGIDEDLVEEILKRIPRLNDDDLVLIADKVLTLLTPDLNKAIEARVEDMFITMASAITERKPVPEPPPTPPPPPKLSFQELVTNVVARNACFRIEAGTTYRKKIWLTCIPLRKAEFYLLHTSEDSPWHVQQVETLADFQTRVTHLAPFHLNQARLHARGNEGLLKQLVPIPVQFFRND